MTKEEQINDLKERIKLGQSIVDKFKYTGVHYKFLTRSQKREYSTGKRMIEKYTYILENLED